MYSKPKKGLGQNFLVDKNIQRKIIKNCRLNASDIILEIGSGRGELTGLIAAGVDKVYALEIDRSLCQFLADKFKGCANIEIINQDILKFDLHKYLKFKGRLKVIGNIPYYISSPIIEHLFNFRDKIDSIFITVQREFAQRMAAVPGSKDYGSFSCFIQYYARPDIIFTIKKTCFLPQPKVDSSFVRLRIRKRLGLDKRGQDSLFRIIRAAFNQRRKVLRNSLKGVIAQEKLEAFFNKYRINPGVRPEDLSLADFQNLQKIQKIQKKY